MMTGIRVYADVLMGSSPLLCVAANLPTSRIAVKGILARKSKNPTPSGIFSQFVQVPQAGDRGLVVLRDGTGRPFVTGPFRGITRGALCIMNAMACAVSA